MNAEKFVPPTEGDLGDNAKRAGKSEGSNSRAHSWISQGLESLQIEQAQNGNAPFDVIIVGSGYGGAVAADRLSARNLKTGADQRIAVLERGREYLRGSFPDTLSELGGHLRFNLPGAGHAGGQLEGLFDVRVGTDMSVLLANGVGGGSLINAGVMLLPTPDTFLPPLWPKEISEDRLENRADILKKELGTSDYQTDEVGSRQAGMRRIDPKAFRHAPITIALKEGLQSIAGVPLEKCIGCCDCATGCNHGAKISLDISLLLRARKNGVALYSGASASKLRRIDDVWELEVWHTDLALRRRMENPLKLRAQRVVLAAGALGSTEILLRSQGEALQLSAQLGRRFSGNGDMIAVLYSSEQKMKAVADDSDQPSSRGIGPTITGMIDWRPLSASENDGDAAKNASCIVQDLGIPGALRRGFEEIVTTTDLMHRLDEGDGDQHTPSDIGIDHCAVDVDKLGKSVAVALISHDSASGTLSAEASKPATSLDAGLFVDPGVRIEWPEARNDPRMEACHDRLERAIGMPGSIGGRLLPNPLWRFLPKRLAGVLGSAPGPVVSVHPLGGCAMGASRLEGVVDHLGRVYDASDADDRKTFPGLIVLDGSIIPSSLGVNPALTISVLADRAIELLCGGDDNIWAPTARKSKNEPERPALSRVRPHYRLENDNKRSSRPTRVEIVERLSGVLSLQGKSYFVELSLAYRSTQVSARGASLRGKTLRVLPHPQLSCLRVFDYISPDNETGIHPLKRGREELRSRIIDLGDKRVPLMEAPVKSGRLRFLHRQRSGPDQRKFRGLVAWARNRGFRDVYQEITERLSGTSSMPLQICNRVRQTLALAQRAGEKRLFEYKILLQKPSLAPDAESFFGTLQENWLVTGEKRVAYEHRSSPIQQLMSMQVTNFGGLTIGAPNRIEVSPTYFAKMHMPLLRITSQQDLPTAYTDIASFGMYIGRILLSNHLWSLRKPDVALARTPQRMPGPLPGLPTPEIISIDAGGKPSAMIRLTVYKKPNSQRIPVLLIHGYSASGTTFAHPALPCSLATFLWNRGAEPWVLDMRSSCGMPTSTLPWRFEDMAEHDIPTALKFMCHATGREQVDVVSHCMGSAMTAMALLGNEPQVGQIWKLVRRWVMTQVTPATIFSPANLLRAYILRYALNIFPGLRYEIGGEHRATTPGSDAIDRILSTIPYLQDNTGSEFEIENPPIRRFFQRSGWVRTRHRMDALFGRVFDARRLDLKSLASIDDLFGDISLATISQTIHFARNGFVSNSAGSDSNYRSNLHRLRDIKTLSLHARQNGLADWETALLWTKEVSNIAGEHRVLLVENCGHQDLLIGTQSKEAFAHINDFLVSAEGS